MADSLPVTVVIPSWRTSQYIAETLNSVLAQDAAPAEIIVVNDGCPETEKLEQVLAPYLEAGQIRYIKQSNKGVSAARNTGIKAATTPLVLVVDSDDILERNCLSSLYALFCSDPKFVLVYAYPVYFGDSKLAGKRGSVVYPVRPGNTATFRDLVARQTYASPVGIFRREVALEGGGYMEFLRIAEDYDLQLRMCRAGRVGYILEPTLYRCRIRPGSLTRSREVENWRAMALEHQLELPGLSEEEIQMVKAEIAFQRAEHTFFSGRRSSLMEIGRRACT
jgi:glycosyltransferase involved in cell wall biosynthesis